MPAHQPNFFQKFIIPAMIGIAAAGATGAFKLAWDLDKKIAVIEQRQFVKIEEFAVVKSELATAQRDIERLREWMKNHVQRNREEPMPAAALER
jgi:hypothetical protein